MLGGGYNTGSEYHAPRPEKHSFWLASDQVNSQRFWIIDDEGIVEVIEDIAWLPIYQWVGYEIIGHTMHYYFEFSG